MGASASCGAANSQTLDRSLARRGQRKFPRESHSISQGDGCPRTLRRALPALRRKGSANSLRRQGNKLLCPLPDWGKSARRSRAIPLVRVRLATHSGRTGSVDPTLKQRGCLRLTVLDSTRPQMKRPVLLLIVRRIRPNNQLRHEGADQVRVLRQHSNGVTV